MIALRQETFYEDSMKNFITSLLSLFRRLSVVLIILSIVIGGMWFFFKNYDWIFSVTVQGEVLLVEKVNPQVAVLTPGEQIPSRAFSFAIKVRELNTNEIYTASAEDRQLAVVEKGNCVELELFPYPPWQLRKAQTWSNARVQRIYNCP